MHQPYLRSTPADGVQWPRTNPLPVVSSLRKWEETIGCQLHKHSQDSIQCRIRLSCNYKIHQYYELLNHSYFDSVNFEIQIYVEVYVRTAQVRAVVQDGSPGATLDKKTPREGCSTLSSKKSFCLTQNRFGSKSPALHLMISWSRKIATPRSTGISTSTLLLQRWSALFRPRISLSWIHKVGPVADILQGFFAHNHRAWVVISWALNTFPPKRWKKVPDLRNPTAKTACRNRCCNVPTQGGDLIRSHFVFSIPPSSHMAVKGEPSPFSASFQPAYPLLTKTLFGSDTKNSLRNTLAQQSYVLSLKH